MTLATETSSKVTASHLDRKAYVYVRQSTLAQVHENTESLERQYELASKAQALGWAPQQVVIVDDDLGRSGADATARTGFKGLVADVGLGKVGVVLGIEVSRLARNNTDWYQLLDLCAMTDTLIADGDGLYHPGTFNDRLVLGLKGTMSEAELHLIRNRLNAGLRHKAAKGELRQVLPVGFVYDEDGTVVMDPDEAVRGAIAEVFRRFDELGSARQVMLSLQGDNLALPRRAAGGRRVSWSAASYSAVHRILTIPAYAGAFAFGRTRSEKRLDAAGQLVVRSRQVARADWEVVLPGHHEGFITWERYERLQVELRANWRPPRSEGGGAVREGTALLQGLVRCGRCGRKMMVAYAGAHGDTPRYLCGAARREHGAGHGCQDMGGKRLDARVLEEAFAVLEPAALAATAKALAEVGSDYRSRLRVFELAVERAGYQAERARRQYDAVEPENRLVARALERSLEQSLTELRQADAELASQRARRPSRLSEDEVAWLQSAGADLRAVFHAPSTTWRQRKQLLRALIAEVVVKVDPGGREAQKSRRAHVEVIWEGGAKTTFVHQLNNPVAFPATDESTVDLVRRLASRYDDRVIAVVLSRQGRRTGAGLPFTKQRVASLRVARGIRAYRPTAAVTPGDDDGVVVSITAAEKLLGVTKATLYKWLADGFISGEQLTMCGPWHIRVTDELRQRIVPEIPAGWLRLEEAAKALGVARQTVLNRVQRGELQAVHVNRGKRAGLRINVLAAQVGLFETTK
jgi:DNA invertase Pin-like site-specific DNA recombinase